MELIGDVIPQNIQQSYMIINFEDTMDSIIQVYQRYINNRKVCELYPTAAKLGKQFEYADKK
jgi:histidyl-tRNA synthetase